MRGSELALKDDFYKTYKLIKTLSQRSGVHLVKLTPDLNSSQHLIIWIKSQKDLNEQVVIKEFTSRSLYTREEKILNKCQNIKNIIKLLHSCPYSNRSKNISSLYFEFCEKGSLKDQISVKWKIEKEEIYSMCYSISTTLFELHRIGVFHRDIKPDNIFLKVKNIYIIGDFGIATDDQTEFRRFCGTKFYMSPSYLKSEYTSSDDLNQLIERNDIFGLGKTIYEVCINEVYVNFLNEDYEQIKIRVLNRMDRFGFKNNFIRIIIDMLEELDYFLYSLQEYIQFFSLLGQGKIVLKDDVKIDTLIKSESGRSSLDYKQENLPRIILSGSRVNLVGFDRLARKDKTSDSNLISQMETEKKNTFQGSFLNEVTNVWIESNESKSEKKSEIELAGSFKKVLKSDHVNADTIKNNNEEEEINSFEMNQMKNEIIKPEVKNFEEFKDVKLKIHGQIDNPLIKDHDIGYNRSVNNTEEVVEKTGIKFPSGKQVNKTIVKRCKLKCFKCGNGNPDLKLKCKHFYHKTCLRLVLESYLSSNANIEYFECLKCYTAIKMTEICLRLGVNKKKY